MGELSNCPECGQSISESSNRRTTRRQSSKAGFTVAIIILLLSVGAIWISPPARTKAVIAFMPNPVVLWLMDMGGDQALDEVVSRTLASPSTLSAKEWDHAIESGLAFQADTSLVWDMRWGQILFDAISADQMSDEQIERYITEGIKFDLQVRAEVHPYTVQIPNQLYRSQERMEPINGGRTGLILLSQITAYGFVGQPPEYQTELHDSNRYVDIYSDGPKSSGSIGMNNPINMSPGESVEMYFEYQVKLKRSIDSEPIFDKVFREERTVSIIDPDIPLIKIVRDEAAAKLVFESGHIMPIQMTEEFETGEPRNSLASSSIILFEASPNFPFAHNIFLVFDDFEAKVGQVVHGSYENSGAAGMIILTPRPWSGFTNELARKLHSKLVESDHVTIELRTDPKLLLNYPEIEECLGVNIVFENVPVEIVAESVWNPGVDLNLTSKPDRYELVEPSP